MILRTLDTRSELAHSVQFAERHGMNSDEVPRSVSNAVGEIVAQVLVAGAVNTLIVFGGDTLLGIMRQINCKGILPEREIAPGVVGARVLGPTRPFTLITKAGGLGDIGIVKGIDAYISMTGQPAHAN